MRRHRAPPDVYAESISGARPVFILAVACGTEWLAAWLPGYGGPGDRLAMTGIGAAIGWLAFLIVSALQHERPALTLRSRVRESLAEKEKP